MSIYAVILTLLLIELMLNVLPGSGQKPTLWPRGQEALLKPDPNLMPGIQEAARFTGNDVGLRGHDCPAAGASEYKIVTIGGSTTEPLYLDDSEEWPHLLIVGLNAQESDTRAWVATVVKAGAIPWTVWI